MSNRLKNATSPYLLQHSENPVDWYPWCEEAFEKARSENKPVFLSVGYSTCHWCHVMAHESFEDRSTAELLNQNYVSIKVDREERPDIDSVYMTVCQAFTGRGGWPMSIFMTPDKKPFFAGTYFPVKSSYGMPGFRDLLIALADHWKEDRSRLLKSAEEMTEQISASQAAGDHRGADDLIEEAVTTFSKNFDAVNGGFGSAPKFPTPHNLLFLTLYAKLKQDHSVCKMVDQTLMQMRKGGIFDQIGFGFSRYSTDAMFLAPHFEKMLYDNALLIMAYAAAYAVSGHKVYLDTCEETASYLLREMTSQDGGFYCAQDADSAGVEGKYYTFRLSEILQLLGEEKGRAFAAVFDITENGNFEGANIPNLLKSGNLSGDYDEIRKQLYDYRKERAKLHLDDKILASWNALAIIALSLLFRVSGNNLYLRAAEKAYLFIEKNLCSGRELFASFRGGSHSGKGFLDDYACYIAALTELYQSTLNKEYLERAKVLSHETQERFADHKNGGFYLCEADQNELFMNPKETYDGAIPSGNSVMAYNFIRLYQLTEKENFNTAAKKQLAFLASRAGDYPAGNSLFLLSLLLDQNPPPHIVIALKEQTDLTEVIKNRPAFSDIIIVNEEEKGRYPLLNGETTYYVCKDHVCLPPVNDLWA